MEKVTLSRVSHFSQDKNGNPLKTQAGKPYTRCLIDLTDGRKASGFGNQITQGWHEGDTVEIILEQKGEYLNFSLPKRQGGMSEEDRTVVKEILAHVVDMHEKINKLYRGETDKTPEYPMPDEEIVSPFDNE